MKKWEDIINAESKDSHWEILNRKHIEGEEKIQLHYVPEDDYSEKDVKINVSYEEWKELVEFIKQLDKKA